ncbi:MAG: hypothetical protein K6E50_05725 [Lachnospiraceae bacterium]|nr:hypothetical protein [Lachnospiraceae bacterium]
MDLIILLPFGIIYDLFLPHYIPIVISLTVIAGAVMVYTKKYKLLIPLFIVSVAVLALVSGCDYVKSRKRVDADWMVGKTFGLVDMRYSVRENLDDPDKGDFYVWEVIDSDWFDGMEGGYRYYFSLQDGKVAGVNCSAYNLDMEASLYDYDDRW